MLIRLMFLIFLLPSYVFANDLCERTPEYIELRDEIYQLVTKPYRECKSSTKSSEHWKAVSNCVADAQGEDAFECGKLVGNRVYPTAHINVTHCELLKPSSEFFIQTLHEIADAKKIVECKT